MPEIIISTNLITFVVFSGGAPDRAALCYKNAAQPSEAAAAVCSRSAERRAASEAGHSAGRLQPQ